MKFLEDGKVKRGYRGAGCDGHRYAEWPGEIVRDLSAEAVRIQVSISSNVISRNYTRTLPLSHHRLRSLLHIPNTRNDSRFPSPLSRLHPKSPNPPDYYP